MKITQEHFNVIKSAINEIDREKALAFYESLKDNKQVKNQTRAFIWGLYNATNLLQFTCKTLYTYVNDTHIETAIFKACNELYPDLRLSLK